jgi:protoporphyrinogen oxidase
MIGVVGGGVAGLAAAYRLQRRGHDVQVFEAGEDLGGLAAVYETAGDPIEKFYHHLSKSEQTIVDLAEELGVGDAVEWRIGKNAYYVDGVVHPMDKPWEILAFPHWSLYDKFRLGMLTLDVDVRGTVPKFDTYETLADFEDQSAVEFAKEHTTENVYDTFFEPLLDAKFGSRKGEVSAAWLLGRIKFRGERDLLRGEVLGYFAGSFAVFLDALVDAVGRENVTTGARVTGLDVGEDGVDSLTVERRASDPRATADGGTQTVTETHAVDDVVVAAMPNVLEDLTGYECDVDFQGTVCSVIAMEEGLTDTYWLNVADEAPFGALIEHTNFVSPERYGGEHLLYAVSYVQDPSEDLWGMDDDEVEEAWLSGIEDLFPEFDRDSVKWVRTARNPRTAPVYEQGYLDTVVPYDLGDEVAEGVYYAGMASEAQYPERSLNGGVVAGFECAELIDRRRGDGDGPRT